MTGKLKVLSLSKEIEGLKEKKSYIDVNIHFRNLNHHTMTLNNKKEYILEITATSIEADSLMHARVLLYKGAPSLRRCNIIYVKVYPTTK